MELEKAIEILGHNWTQLFNPFYKEEELNNALNMATKTLNQTVKAEPIRHGRWEYKRDIHGFYSRCSKCGEAYDTNGALYEWNYCPNCGAKMDEVTE